MRPPPFALLQAVEHFAADVISVTAGVSLGIALYAIFLLARFRWLRRPEAEKIEDYVDGPFEKPDP